MDKAVPSQETPVELMPELRSAVGVYYLEGKPPDEAPDPEKELAVYTKSKLYSQTIARAYKFHYTHKKSPLKLTKFMAMIGVPEQTVCAIGQELSGTSNAPALKLHIGNNRKLLDICIGPGSGSCLPANPAIQKDLLASKGVLFAVLTDQNDKLQLRCVFHQYVTKDNNSVMVPVAIYGPQRALDAKLITESARRIKLPVYKSQYCYASAVVPAEHVRLTKGPNASKAHYDAQIQVDGKLVTI